MADGVFIVRPRVEDDRTGISQCRSELCSANLGGTCNTAQDPIEDTRRVTSIRRRLRLHLSRRGYCTHQHHSNDQHDSSLLIFRHSLLPFVRAATPETIHNWKLSVMI